MAGERLLIVQDLQKILEKTVRKPEETVNGLRFVVSSEQIAPISGLLRWADLTKPGHSDRCFIKSSFETKTYRPALDIFVIPEYNESG